MSGWWASLFGGGDDNREYSKPLLEPVSTEDTMDSLQDNVNGLRHKRMQLLRNKQKADKETKDFYAKKEIEQAKAALKRSKIYAAQIQQLEGQISNLEQTSMAVEGMATALTVAESMKHGAAAMKTLTSQMSVDEVHDAADMLQDAVSESHELIEAVSQPLILGTPVDDDDLLAEMASWGGGNGGGEQVIELPSVPVSKSTDPSVEKIAQDVHN